MAEEANVNLLNRYPILTGIIDRVTLVGLTWGVSKGFITNADIANIAPLVPVILAALIGWYQNRKVALAQQATTIAPGTKVVTTPEIAAATPDNMNILSTTTQEVVNK